jgi:ribosomal protein L1
MATTKAELLKEAKTLGIEVDAKSKISEIRALIEAKNADAPQISEETPESPEEAPAKAGKRSTKALAEAAELQAKEERKSHPETESKPKVIVPPTRSRLQRRGKHFRKSAEQIEVGKSYTLEQAAALAKKTSHVKFDATVELHVNLGVDPKHADQNIRDNVALPAGTGKKVRIAVLSDDPEAAKAAGADLYDNDALLAALEKGSIGFDILISTPANMSKLGKYARILGPRGLMPNPKSGTVTADTAKAIKEAKAGRVEYRVDSTGIVHLGLGKVSFTEAQITQNLQAVLTSIKANKPQSVKGNYLNAVYVSTSMGPSIPIDISTIG